MFGLWCFIWPVRGRWPSAAPLVWLWVLIELINGIGHPLWTLAEWKYTPGVATAPFLLFPALYLAWQLLRGALASSPSNNRWRGPGTVGGYAPRAREDSVRPRRLIGASGRPLNFASKDFPVVSTADGVLVR